MLFNRFAPLLLASSLVLSACHPANADDQAFGDRVRAYLLSHPEVLRDAMLKLQDQQQADAAQRQKTAIAKRRQALEHDPLDFVANPHGKVTVTEFYDYRCPHCVNAAPAVEALIRTNPNVRFVFKEFPIFGAPSERAAAIAVDMSGGDGLGVYKDLMAARPLNEAALDDILKAHGLSPERLDNPAVKARVSKQLTTVRQLAQALDLDGTPAFIIGDTVVAGEDMDAVQAAIKHAGG